MISLASKDAPKEKKPRFERRSGNDLSSMYSYDFFPRTMTFSLGEGFYDYRSGWGTLCTLLAFFIFFLYCVEKVFVQDNLTFYTESHIYEPDVIVGREQGFEFAFALTPYTGDMS